jgi:hypothetical protein
MFANRMCLGSQGCGSPTVRSLRRRFLPMRFTSSTTALFYNLRPSECPKATEVNHEQEKGREPKSRPKASPSNLACYSFWLKKNKYRSVRSAVSAAAM